MSIRAGNHPVFLVCCEPNTNLLNDFTNSFHQLGHHMQKMENNMSDMNRYYNQNLPINSRSREVETWHAENPVVTDKEGNRKLQLRYDVRQFKPEEISIRTKDGQLIVHAKHEESSDNSKVYKEYRRSFTLPKDLNLDSLKSSLSRDGILTIEAPLPAAIPETPQERTIAIEHVK